MKKIIYSLVTALSIVFVFANTNLVFAEEVGDNSLETKVIPVILNTEEKEKMLELGFSLEELDSLSEEEYNEFKNLDGKLESSDSNFYEIKTDISGEIKEVQVYNEQEALRQINLQNDNISTFATNTTTTSWMKMTTTSSKLTNGNTLLKNTFTWIKKYPLMRLTDVVAITHSASAVKVSGTEGFSYKYTDGTGTYSVAASSTTRNAAGIAKKFDLKSYGKNADAYNHNGYISVQVKKGNANDISANAFGHYSHTTLGVAGTITLKSGSVSVGGVKTSDKMPDTMITFNY